MKIKLFFIIVCSIVLYAHASISIVQAQTIRTQNFIIHNNTSDPTLSKETGRVIEDRLARYYPASVLSRPIEVYIGNDPGKPLGMTTVEGSIHLRQGAPNFFSIASHELSHAVCAQLCPGRWPKWLTEGLAMLSEGIAYRNITDWSAWLNGGLDILAKEDKNWFTYIKKNGRHYDPRILLTMSSYPTGEEETAFYADSTALVYFLLTQRIAHFNTTDISPHEVISSFFNEARTSPAHMDRALAKYFGIQGGVSGLDSSFKEWEEKNIFSVTSKKKEKRNKKNFPQQPPHPRITEKTVIFDKRAPVQCVPQRDARGWYYICLDGQGRQVVYEETSNPVVIRETNKIFNDINNAGILHIILAFNPKTNNIGPLHTEDFDRFHSEKLKQTINHITALEEKSTRTVTEEKELDDLRNQLEKIQETQDTLNKKRREQKPS